jgi:hypothetical protein
MILTLQPMSAATMRSAAKRAAAAARDPKAKQQQRGIAKNAEAEAIEIENDVA